MQTITIQKRELEYLLEKAHTTLPKITKHFDDIDFIMESLKIGDTVYETNIHQEPTLRTVTKIIDKENGIIETQGKDKDYGEIRCILDYKVKHV